MTLQEAIKQTLLIYGGLSVEEIATILNTSHVYRRKDGQLVPPVQVQHRINKYPELFSLKEGKVVLKSLGLSILKELIDKASEVLERSKVNPQHLQELLLPALALFLKYGNKAIVSQYTNNHSEPSLEGLLQELTRLNSEQRFYQLVTLPIKLITDLEPGLKQRLAHTLAYRRFRRDSDLNQNALFAYYLQNPGAIKDSSDPYDTTEIEEEEFIQYFNNLINEFAWKRYFSFKLGSTPGVLIDLITRLVTLADEEVVFDPFTGKSSLLTTLLRASAAMHLQVIGGDINEDAVLLSQMNFAVHHLPAPLIVRKNAFTDWVGQPAFADWFISNPPFFKTRDQVYMMAAQYGAHRDTTSAIVALALYHLKPKGRACLLLPESFATAATKAVKEVRRQLVERNYVHAVVSLPNGMFAPYSNIKSTLLLLDTGRELRGEQDVFLYDASHVKAQEFGKASQEIVEAFHRRANPQQGSWVPLPTIRAKDCSLDLRVLFTTKPEFSDNAHYKSVADLLPHPAPNSVTGIFYGNAVQKEYLSEQEGIPYFQITDLRSDFSQYTVSGQEVKKFVSDTEYLRPRFIPRNSVLVAKSGELLKPTLYTGSGEAMCSANIICLEVDLEQVLPDYFILQLHQNYVQEQINYIRRGTTIPSFRIEELLTVKIYTPSTEEQRMIVERERQSLLSKKVGNKEAALLIGELMHKANGPLGSVNAALERLLKYFVRKQDSGEPVSLNDVAIKLLPGERPEQVPQYRVGDTLKRMQVNIKRVSEYMHRSLLYAQLNEKELNLEPIALHDILQDEVVPDNEYKIKVLVSAKEPYKKSKVLVDKSTLLAVFDNLIDNAYVHGFKSNPGPDAKVHIFWEAKKTSIEAAELLITVENNGAPAPSLTTEKFIMAGETTNGERGGMGIGGAFIHKALEQMNGRLLSVVDTSEKVGEYNLQFIFKLPLYE